MKNYLCTRLVLQLFNNVNGAYGPITLTVT